LRKHPAVKECVVFGVASADAERTEKIVACVEAQKVSDAELKAFLTEYLAGWQIPREFWFVPEIAPNVRGKLSRAEWRKRYLAGKVE
jgi:long-chain acyl-CoA synthetase